MLCEECHVNEANFTVSVVTGEETTVRHLCADCMSRMNSDLMKGNVRSLLNTVLSAIQATAENGNRKEFSMPRNCSSPMWARNICCSRCSRPARPFRKPCPRG